MTKKKISLLEIDEAKITILMDNTVDLLMTGSEVAHRFDLSSNRTYPIAEHGFSALIQVKCGDTKGTVIFDAGLSSNGILHNIDASGVDLDDIQTVILSHGHSDHTLGLPNLIEKLGSQKVSLVFTRMLTLRKKL